MKIKKETPIFENEMKIEDYSSDFASQKLEENTFAVSTDEISGNVQQIQLDGLFLEVKNLISSNGFSEKINTDFSFYKIHFQLNGQFTYTPQNEINPFVEIPQGHCNLYFLPETEAEGILNYKETEINTFEICFTNYFLQKTLGEEFKEILKQFGGNKTENGCVLWQKSKFIPEEVQQKIKEIIECPYSGQIKKAFLESKIISLLISCFIKPNKDAVEKQENSDSLHHNYPGVLQVEQYIRQNLNQPITIAELAIVAGFNTSKLKQNFKKVFSTTIFKYITKLRMEKAKDLIQKKNYSVSEAAYEVGYKNPQHFTVAFKKFYGYLPSTLIE